MPRQPCGELVIWRLGDRHQGGQILTTLLAVGWPNHQTCNQALSPAEELPSQVRREVLIVLKEGREVETFGARQSRRGHRWRKMVALLSSVGAKYRP